LKTHAPFAAKEMNRRGATGLSDGGRAQRNAFVPRLSALSASLRSKENPISGYNELLALLAQKR
jgi:hypothetical protein